MYSIGYATKPLPDYLDQLAQQGINVVADVRSVPYSKTFHDYNRETFQAHLKRAGVRYVYLGQELGPRSKSPAHYNSDNQVQFDRLMTSPLFIAGIERLKQGIDKGYTIALHCAEKDPATCHRSLLVGWSLRHQYNLELTHIRHNGGLETQSGLEARLMTLTDTLPDMLLNETEAMRLAYRRQCLICAYKIPP